MRRMVDWTDLRNKVRSVGILGLNSQKDILERKTDPKPA